MILSPHSERRARGVLAALLALVVLHAAGCGSLSRVRTAAGRIEAPTTAQKPASLETLTESTALPIPAGATVELIQARPVELTAEPGPMVPPPPSWRITLPQPAELRSETRIERAQTATGYAPPSPAELARGSGVRAFWLAGLGCLIVAGLFAWRAHYLAALCAGGAGLGLPVIANVLSSSVSTHFATGMLCAAAAFAAAWHILKPQLVQPD